MSKSFKKDKKYELYVNSETLAVIKEALNLYEETINEDTSCFINLYPELHNDKKKATREITGRLFNSIAEVRVKLDNEFSHPTYKKEYKLDNLKFWKEIFCEVEKNSLEYKFTANMLKINFLAEIIEFYMRMHLGDYGEIPHVLANVFTFTDVFEYVREDLRQLRFVLLPEYVNEYGNNLNGHYGIMNTNIPEKVTFIAYPLWQNLSGRENWQGYKDCFKFDLIEIN